MNEIMQHVVYGGGFTVFLVAIVTVPYIIGYKQGRATAKAVALDTLAHLWSHADSLQREVEEAANKEDDE